MTDGSIMAAIMGSQASRKAPIPVTEADILASSLSRHPTSHARAATPRSDSATRSGPARTLTRTDIVTPPS
jgi:hypothetical protein